MHTTWTSYRGLDLTRGAVDVYVDGELAHRDELTGGDALIVDLRTYESGLEPGPSHTTVVHLPEGEHEVELWLPHHEAVELIALRSDAPVEPVPSAKRRWLHHGSSISHGSNATAPSDIWPAVAARRADVDLVNLGLGGSALVDPFLARVIRDAEADVISVNLGINVVNLDGMRVRTFVPAVHGFLDTIRDGHPDTPLLLVSPVFCGIHEATPGPGAFDPEALARGEVRFVATGNPAEVAQGRLTLEVVRRELASLMERRASDPTCTSSTGSRSSAPRTPSGCRCPTTCTPAPRRTG